MSQSKKPATRAGQRRGTSQSRKVACVFCSTDIDKDTQALCCDSCQNWVCLPCCKVSPALYAELTKEDSACPGNDSVSWLCSVCKGMKSDLKTININILELKNTSEKRLTQVENRLDNLEGNIQDTVRKEVVSSRDELVETVKSDIAETVEKLVNARVKEIDDIKNRANNLVLFHVDLSTADSPMERKQHDIDIVKSLYSNLFPSKEELNLVTCFRMGKKNAPKRPLKVICARKAQRRDLLLESSKIKSLSDEKLKKIVISKDLTVAQQKANKKLQAEKKARQEQGDSVIIRGGEVVAAPVSEESDDTPSP